MIVVKDAMVVIHLAKISVLNASCKMFGQIVIPRQVEKEIMGGKGVHPEVPIIQKGIKRRSIQVKEAKKSLIKKCNEFNIYGGEAAAIALYWQEKADLLVTDDDNVRKKKLLLDLNIIGTPAILLSLYRKKIISKEKALLCVEELSKIGWFSQTVLDKMIMEVEK